MFVFVVLVSCLVSQSVGETPGCGRSSLSSLGTEIRKAALGEYPSMCNVFTHEKSGQRIFVGGASLIQHNQVVTLATLVERLKTPSGEGEESDFNFDLRANDEECGDELAFRKVMVICGNVDLQGEEGEGAQTRMVSRVLVHPDYSPTALINDLAVLLVEESFEYTDSVSQVCLPRPGKKYANKESCLAVGHGQDGWADPNDPFGTPVYSRNLNQVSLPLWDGQECEDTLNNKHFQPNHSFTWKKHPSFLCAGGVQDRDTCVGDGGGPLLCQSREGGTDIDFGIFGSSEAPDPIFDLRQSDEAGVKLVQAGITAWGIECGREGYPGVYSDLRDAACWLDQIMSCHPTAKLQDLIDLRSDTSGSGKRSANGLTSSECRAWLENRRGAQTAACGCVQSFEDPAISIGGDVDLRNDRPSLDLRTDEE